MGQDHRANSGSNYRDEISQSTAHLDTESFVITFNTRE